MADGDLVTKLQDWLESQGYPLEMRVARASRSEGLMVAQSTYYSDPETNQPREIDIAAWHSETIAGLDVQITCFIECKNTKQPWVLFTPSQPSSWERYSYYNRVASSLGKALLSGLYRVEGLALPPLLSLPPRVGYGIAQAFAERNQDLPFEAVMSAAKAAISHVLRVDADSSPSALRADIALPVVVISGLLYECFLDDAGKQVLSALSSGILDLGMPLPGRGANTLVHILTEAVCGPFFQQVLEVGASIKTQAPRVAERLVTSWRLDEERKQSGG